MNIMGVSQANTGKAIVRNRDGSVVGTRTYRKSGSGKKKALRYSFKRISAQILASKTPGVARRVVSKARHEVVNLLRKKNGGYDEDELRHAIIHAERMVRVAKKRMRHLQEEQDARKKGGICEAEIAEKVEDAAPMEERLLEDLGGEEILSQEEMKKLMEEFEEIMRELEEEGGLDLEELMPIVPREMDPEDLELLKKKHRAQEMRDIMQADMKYLKAMFNKLERERQEGIESIKSAVSPEASAGSSRGPGGGVSLELGGVVAAQGAQPLTQITVMTEGGSIDISL